MDVSAEEGRVLGVLVEKQRTTPAEYPLTANAVVRACNQSTSRDPVVSYDEATVDAALGSLREKGLTRIVYSPSNRSPKHRHVLDEALGLDDEELVVLALLVLRGPQTSAELRARSERLHRFDDPDLVVAALQRLSGRNEPLVALLDRAAGRKEARWAQRLYPDLEGVPSPAARQEAARRVGAAPAADDRIGHLPVTLQRLQAQIDELRTRVDELVAALGGDADRPTTDTT